MNGSTLDVVYVAASAGDARYTRICVASIRYFYPNIPIRILGGGPLERGLTDELARHWNVGVADLPAGDYGWGFVKLEPLFGRPGERFLVLDSDTVLVGPVLELLAASRTPFLVDDEAQSDADAKRLYYDWEKLRELDPAAARPGFVFNSGQWFGTAGLVTREDFGPWIEWSMPPRLRRPDSFMPGDQGVLNYVLNRKVRCDRLQVERRKLMRWPGHGMDGLTKGTVAARTAPALVVHWAGMKKARLGEMIGADVLDFFERLYYSRLPAGEVRRLAAGARHVMGAWIHSFRAQLKMLRRRFGSYGLRGTDPAGEVTG